VALISADDAQAPVAAVYFTAVPLHMASNGGALVCREHIERLASDPAVDLLVALAGPPEHERGSAAVAEAAGARFAYFPFRPTATRAVWSPVRGRWPFLYEATALEQPHVDASLVATLRKEAADVLVCDYVPSAVLIPSAYSAPVCRVTITLNREGDFYRELRRLGRLPPDASSSPVAAWRAARFERWVYRHSDCVVALTPGDLPRLGRRAMGAVIPPVFEPKPVQWRDAATDNVFFVGNIGHYPNYTAVEWLATKLAPALEQLASTVRIRIVGAGAEDAAPAWRRPNVDFLGVGDADTVQEEFLRAALFVAPVANPFGSKIKLLDCLAYATPFVATREALSGLPFVNAIPEIRLDQPGEAAALITSLVRDRTALAQASDRMREELQTFLQQQQGVWGRLLRSVCDVGVRSVPGLSAGRSRYSE
jgi:glycosyltransferase involved in cell wall biosynthesis